MENNEYVIINKTAIQKRIEELKKRQKDFLSNHPDDISVYDSLQIEIDILEKIISQSIPLIPEIENAFTKGERYGWDSQKSIGNIDEMREKIKIQSLEQYISNLKLEIK